jgi:hypothetical protein
MAETMMPEIRSQHGMMGGCQCSIKRIKITHAIVPSENLPCVQILHR